MSTTTKAQIAEWKKAHSAVYEIEVEGKKAYLRQPDRQILSAVSAKINKDPLGANELLLKNCWLGGDELLKTDDAYFLSVIQKLDELVQTKTASLKKL